MNVMDNVTEVVYKVHQLLVFNPKVGQPDITLQAQDVEVISSKSGMVVKFKFSLECKKCHCVKVSKNLSDLNNWTYDSKNSWRCPDCSI